jgi:predicted metalloprotease with PDZ domain
MKHRLFYILLATLSISAIAQDQSASYKYSLDLVNIKDDMAKVELIVPKLEYGDSIEFQFPKIVPGTYSIYDFGRFIHEFQAFDIDNQELKVIKIDPNRRQILNSKKLYRISYYVEDTYDSDKDTVIFEPAGTNFQIGKNYDSFNEAAIDRKFRSILVYGLL